MTSISTEIIDHYSMTEAERQLVMNGFVSQGLKEFTVRLNAFGEQNTGAVSSGINSVKSFVRLGAANHIAVHVDFHTWNSNFPFGSNNYLNYVAANIEALQAEEVATFQLFNEPPAQQATASQNNYLLSIIQKARDLTTKPVSGRFMGMYNCYTNHYSREIDEALDYVCVNAPWVSGDYWNPLRNYPTYEQTLKDIIAYAHDLGKHLWITEFGKQNASLPATDAQKESQRAAVAAMVTWMKTNGVDLGNCWVYQPDHVGTEHFNITDGNFTNYPAFSELKSDDYIPPIEPPIPPATDTDTNIALPFVAWYPDNPYLGWGYPVSDTIYFDDFNIVRTQGTRSIRIEAAKPSNSWREISNMNQNVSLHHWEANAGDRFIFKAWCKCNPSTIGTPNGERTFTNPCIYVDIASNQAQELYGDTYVQTIFDQASFTSVNPFIPQALHAFAPSGCDWTELYLDITIPATVEGHPWHSGTYTPPFNFTPQIHAGQPIGGANEQATAWFTDVEEYWFPAGSNPQVPPPTRTITINPNPNGTVLANTQTQTYGYGSITLAEGELLWVKAIPNEGYTFNGFTTAMPDGSTGTININPFSTVISNDMSIWLKFSQNQPNPSLAARMPMVGNSALTQIYMRKLRDKIISKEVHRKLHPLV